MLPFDHQRLSVDVARVHAAVCDRLARAGHSISGFPTNPFPSGSTASIRFRYHIDDTNPVGVRLDKFLCHTAETTGGDGIAIPHVRGSYSECGTHIEIHVDVSFPFRLFMSGY